MLIRKTALLEVNSKRETIWKQSKTCLSSITSGNIEKFVCYQQQKLTSNCSSDISNISSIILPLNKTSKSWAKKSSNKRHNNLLCTSYSCINLRPKRQIVNPKANINSLKYYNTNYHQGSPKAYKMITKQIIYFPTALLLALACALSTMNSHFVQADSALLSNMQKLKISPDVIGVTDYTNTIRVELHGNVVKPGDPVPAKHFKDLNMAKITWDVNNFDNRYTLLLLDLDRKPGPNNTQNIYNQFTSLNIPGNVINAGQTIVAFDTPIVPCQPSTKHRILMLAFIQDQNIDISEVAYMSASSGHSVKRENFKLDDFIRRHRLDLAAANVFLAIGESNGICSGGSTLHSFHSLSTILIAMVTAITAYGFSSSSSSSKRSQSLMSL